MRTITDCAIECMGAYRSIFKCGDPPKMYINQCGDTADIVFDHATFTTAVCEDGWNVQGYIMHLNNVSFDDLVSKHRQKLNTHPYHEGY